MNRNSGVQKSFFVIYPETNRVEMKYFKQSPDSSFSEEREMNKIS